MLQLAGSSLGFPSFEVISAMDTEERESAVHLLSNPHIFRLVPDLSVLKMTLDDVRSIKHMFYEYRYATEHLPN